MKPPSRLGLTMLALGAAAMTSGSTTSQAPRPLTFANVRSFFSDTLHIRPTEVQKRCVIFYEGEWQNANTYNYCVIIVENSDEDLQLTFYLTDDREMNWVNEFLDSPFFTRSETENLFRLLNQKQSCARRTSRPFPGRREPLGTTPRRDHRLQLYSGAASKALTVSGQAKKSRETKRTIVLCAPRC